MALINYNYVEEILLKEFIESLSALLTVESLISCEIDFFRPRKLTLFNGFSGVPEWLECPKCLCLKKGSVYNVKYSLYFAALVEFPNNLERDVSLTTARRHSEKHSSASF